MAEQPVSSAPSTKAQSEDRLDSWKEIAAYLNRDVTTVQRWERREGMPVHRHVHDRIGSVYASRAELDAWTRSRSRGGKENGNQPADNTSASPSLAAVAPRAAKWLWALSVAAAIVIAASLWIQKTDYFWRNPIANARFEAVTDFEEVEEAATISRDGHFIAFLSDRDGQMDVWLTQVGSGQFHNLTHGSVHDLVNPAIRALAFSPDESLVTFWVRKQDGSPTAKISIWSVPTLGGEPRPYLENAGDLDWSPDGSRLVYHCPAPGDPLLVVYANNRSEARPIYTAPDGLHCHFPLWAPDSHFIYFVRGSPPDQLDIWRIASGGGVPERITSHNGRVTYPVLLDRQILLYLATDSDGSGPWLFGMNVDHRIPHRLTSGPDRYTSLAATADARRLVATLATPTRTLWRLPLADSPAEVSAASPISLTTSTGFSPRLGPNYLLYVSAIGTGESIWKLADGNSTELWRGDAARVVGGPAISADGRLIAFTVRQRDKTLMYAIDADGTNARVLTASLDLHGAPAWSPDGQSIITAAADHGTVHLFRVTLDGVSPRTFIQDYSTDPSWAPDGRLVVYSGPDIGTTFSVKAVTSDGAAHSLPDLMLTRGARHLAFLPGGNQLIFLRGDLQHKDLWLINLDTGAQRQLTSFPPEFEVRDFDISPDGRNLVLERVQERSDVVLLKLPK